MKVYPIRTPLPGEQVVGIDPPLAPEVDVAWRRRLNLTAGRALDAEALIAEQDGRAGRLATGGQALSPGVVAGLDVAVENDPTEGTFLRVRAGTGLMHSGEDVVVPTDLRIALKDLRVLWPLPDTVPPPAGEGDEEEGDANEGDAEDAGGAPAVDLAHEPPPPRFEDWTREGASNPRAGILVLQPVELELLPLRQGADDPAADPCEDDPSAFAFENWERRDACRPVLYPWPTHWRPLPVRDARWRNALAYTVFREEGRKGPDAAFPWEMVGVPIGLMAFGDDWKPLFVDRASVVRAGGKPKRRTTLVPGAGSPFLWRARFDQLLEELADADAQNALIADIAARFRYVPPSGLLPKSACSPELAQQWFFPSSYVIDAAPVPIEHLDVALEASASLGRYDLFTPDQVRLLVPVPQKVWEPRLLHGEDVDPRFQQAIDEAVTRRLDWLSRRESVRQKAAVLLQAMTGLRPAYPSPDDDPGRLEDDEETTPYPPALAGRPHQSGLGPGVHRHGFTGATTTLALETNDRFVVWVFCDPANPPVQLLVTLTGKHGADAPRDLQTTLGANVVPVLRRDFLGAGPLPPLGRWVRIELNPVPTGVQPFVLTGAAFTSVDGRATWARAGKSPLTDPSPAMEVVWVGDDLPGGATATPSDVAHEAWTWIDVPAAPPDLEVDYRTLVAGSLPLIRVAEPVERLVDEIKSRLIGWGELSVTYSQGISRFIDVLQAAIDQANDQINFGYLRVQTAMYRLRQSILGDKVADRLVTSPVLAAIAKESAGAAQVNKSLTEIFVSMQSTEQAKKPQRWWGRELEVKAPVAAVGAAPAHRALGGALLTGVSMLTTKPRATVFDVGAASQLDAAREAARQAADARARMLAELVQRPGAQEPPIREAAPPASDIEGARPVVDKAIRTTSIAERILDSRAAEAKDFCSATKRDVIKGLLGLTMNVEDLPVLGLAIHDDAGAAAPGDKSPERTPPDASLPEGPGNLPSIHAADIGPADLKDIPDKNNMPKFRGAPAGTLGRQIMFGTGMPAREALPRSLATYRGADPGSFNATLLNWITNEADPLEPADNEANYFAIGSDVLNQTIALLRTAEGRVAEYGAVITRAQQTVDELTAAALESDRRLKLIEDELTEARNDVATARALLLDEMQRVRAINERREAILRDYVKFIAYHRPRLTDPLVDAPVRALDPGPTPSPVPECLSHDEPVPPEVNEYLDLVRDAPVSWFAHAPSFFDFFDRLPMIQNVLSLAKTRSQFPAAAVREAVSAGPVTIMGQALMNVKQAQGDVLGAVKRQRQAMDLTPLATESWTTLRALAPALVGLGDLMDAAHGRSDVAHLATQELDQIARVAGCLYRHFSLALPMLRLEWAEQFSQYDAEASLRSLAVLPHWSQVDVLERREMQTLVDWFFLRIDPEHPEAVSLINDLVRTCLLVASHSPVNQILSGHVQQDTPVQPGGRVRVVIPAVGVRVGMHALLYKGTDIVARAVVEDLSEGVAAARIIHAEKSETLAQGARVQFTQAPATPTPKVVVAAMMARSKA